jgi:hypothetical protein
VDKKIGWNIIFSLVFALGKILNFHQWKHLHIAKLRTLRLKWGIDLGVKKYIPGPAVPVPDRPYFFLLTLLFCQCDWLCDPIFSRWLRAAHTACQNGVCGHTNYSTKLPKFVHRKYVTLVNIDVGTLLQITQQKNTKTMKKLFISDLPTLIFSRYETRTTGFFYAFSEVNASTWYKCFDTSALHYPGKCEDILKKVIYWHYFDLADTMLLCNAKYRLQKNIWNFPIHHTRVIAACIPKTNYTESFHDIFDLF